MIFFLCSSVCGCGVVLMVAFWEVGDGCGRVAAEEQCLFFIFFNNSLSLSSFLAGKKLNT